MYEPSEPDTRELDDHERAVRRELVLLNHAIIEQRKNRRRRMYRRHVTGYER